MILRNSKFKGHNPDIKIVADELSLSTRNLQIKLKKEDNSFKKLVNQVRKEIALNHINKSDYSFYDIAFLLGFSEQSSFNHAFKRWTGYNPNQYLKRMNII